jgi:hypothetical protein
VTRLIYGGRPTTPLFCDRQRSKPKLPSPELTAEDLEKVSSGFSMSYSMMQWEYTKQDDTGAAKGK